LTTKFGGSGRICSWPIAGYLLEDWRKPSKTSVRATGNPAYIWAAYLLNTNLENHHHSTCSVWYMLLYVITIQHHAMHQSQQSTYTFMQNVDGFLN
jgi:hypothetical protein